jgi:hypothetical protein
MNAVTEIAWLNETKSTVFEFLADVTNLPKWATEFAESGRWDGPVYKVRTSQGELIVRHDADARTGVIDIHAGPTPEQMGLFPVRVLGMGDRSAVTFTFFQAPDMPDDFFAQQHASLRKELAALPGVVRMHRAEPSTRP